jgi:peptidoglycan/LPS O-acetylase OafA/YrhL
VEFIAYLAFPFMLPWIWRASTPAKVGLTGVVVAVLSLFSWLTGNNFDQWDGPQTLLRCLPEFLLGTLLYAAFTSDAGTNWLRRDATVVTTAAVALILLHLGAADLFAILCFPVLILAAVSNEGYVAKLMNVAPLVWLGEVSYSLYLVHGFVEYATTQFIDAAGLGGPAAFSGKASVVVMLTMIGASLAMSSVTYRSVESAGRRRLRQMLGQAHA